MIKDFLWYNYPAAVFTMSQGYKTVFMLNLSWAQNLKLQTVDKIWAISWDYGIFRPP